MQLYSLIPKAYYFDTSIQSAIYNGVECITRDLKPLKAQFYVGHTNFVTQQIFLTVIGLRIKIWVHLIWKNRTYSVNERRPCSRDLVNGKREPVAKSTTEKVLGQRRCEERSPRSILYLYLISTRAIKMLWVISWTYQEKNESVRTKIIVGYYEKQSRELGEIILQ